MAITPIDPLTAGAAGLRGPTQLGCISPAGQSVSAVKTDGKGDSGFVGMLERALGDLNDLAGRADGMAAAAATGEDVDLHQLMLTMQNATLGFQLTTQVRNKLVDAYQEIMRMQV